MEEQREVEEQLANDDYNYDDVLDDGMIDDLDLVEREVNN